MKQIESGWEISDNPGTWTAEGLDRSGIFSVAFEINNALDKAGPPGLYTAATAFPSASQKQPASRFATRSAVGAFLGPSFGMAGDAVGMLSLGFENMRRVARGETPTMTESDVATVQRLTPFASPPYWSWLIDRTIVPEIKKAVQ